MSNQRVCVMGDYDSICAFKVLGIDPYAVSSAAEAENMLQSLIGKEYPIIFITENFAAQLTAVLNDYRTKPLPAIIPIPSVNGSTGFGIGYVKKAVEQAVGSDIIFNND